MTDEGQEQQMSKEKATLIHEGPHIVFNASQATARFDNLLLNASNPKSPEVTIVVQKKTLPIIQGRAYDNGRINFDKESDKMQVIAAQAEALKALPEEQRPREVMNLLRQNVKYAYDEVINSLR